ncbi:MAG TPA: urease accessory protein UreD [Kofleriaceae bacterium]
MEPGGLAPTRRIDVASAVVRPGIGRSDVHRARGAGPLRLLCPRAAGDAAWIVTSSLGGGLVDGDAVALEVSVDAGATAVVTTQASTKVYKGSSQQRTRVTVAGDGAVLVVPDPVVPYRDAAFVQVTDVELARDSTLVLCDVLTAGRVAYGERWSATRLDTTLRISIDGSLALHDRIVLAGDVAAHMQRFTALATALLVGPRVTELAAGQLAALGVVERGAPVIVAGSPLVGGALFRICGEDVEAVVVATRALLRDACAQLGEDPWSRKW